jgi:uncharacterized protein
MEYIKRKIKSKINKLAQFFPVVTVTGARQTGKTTVLKETFPNFHYVTLDLPSTAEQAELSPTIFLKEHAPPVIIDEIQYAPKLFRFIKSAVDEQRHSMGNFILTGSQKFTMMKGVSESLAGRTALLELEGLSYEEVKATYVNLAIKEFLVRGQFPELWRSPSTPSGIFYSSYISTYLERDVREILQVTSLRDFERFVRALAARNGQLLNKTDLAKEVGISTKAINDWINVAQASNQIILLEPFFRNFGKRIAKTPKVYFCDTGLLCALIGINLSNLENSPFIGTLWEALVFSELRKQLRLKETQYSLWFYRDQRAREVDLILERGGVLHLIEIKWTENPRLDAIKNIEAINSDLAIKGAPYIPGQHYVVCNTSKRYEIKKGIEVISLPEFLEVIKNEY